MIPATNPFVTEELLQSRATQRRLLRRIPARLVLDASADVVKPPELLDRVDRVAIEIDLRDQASEAAEQLRPVLASYAGSEFVDQLVQLHTDLIRHRAGRLDIGPPHVAALSDPLLGMLFEDLDRLQQRRESMVSIRLDPERSAAVHRLVVLLVIADLLAGDDYQDPRLP